jgi:hypothetical protein
LPIFNPMLSVCGLKRQPLFRSPMKSMVLSMFPIGQQ